MVEKRTFDLKTRPEPVDATFVYAGKPVLAATPLTQEQVIDLMLEEVPKSERRVVLEETKFALEAIRALAYAAKKAGSTDNAINSALTSFLEKEGGYWPGKGLKPGKVLAPENLGNLLKDLGAGDNISINWVFGTLGLIKEKIWVEKPADAGFVFSDFSKNGLGPTFETHLEHGGVARKMGFAAELAYRFQESGASPMDKYVKNKNDCFSFCELVLSIAKGEANSAGVISRGEVNGTINPTWYSTETDEKKIKAGGSITPGRAAWIRKRAEQELVGKVEDSSIVKAFSVSGGLSGEHWAVVSGQVYDFNGRIRKQSMAKFLKETGAIRWVLRPLEESRGSGGHSPQDYKKQRTLLH